MNNLILSLLAGSGGGISVSLILFYFVRLSISERLKKSIEYEYSSKLETHKAILIREQELNLEKLKMNFEKEKSILNTAIAGMLNSRHAFENLRVKSIEILWKSISDINVVYSDLLTSDNAAESSNGNIQNLLIVFNNSSNEVQKVRPFLGELLYSYHEFFLKFISFQMSDFISKRINNNSEPWFKREKFINWIYSSLGEDVGKAILSKKEDKINQAIQKEIEDRILLHCARVISGEESASFGVEQAKKIQNAAIDNEIEPQKEFINEKYYSALFRK